MEKKIEIYKTRDKETRVEVRFEQDTVWLTQQQLAQLFKQTKQNISLHINNCFKEKELVRGSVVKESLTTASDGKKYRTQYYNLDVIISVGYRVKSIRGTQFRQWATRRLREYLVDGYSINKKRLAERDLEVRRLKTGITILRRAVTEQAVDVQDAAGLADLLNRFSGGLALLDDYDHETLDRTGKTRRKAVVIKADEYRKLIDSMRSGSSVVLFFSPHRPIVFIVVFLLPMITGR